MDKLDDVPCHINWAVVNAPAYVTTEGAQKWLEGKPAKKIIVVVGKIINIVM